jgi:hypothetical protein
MEKTRIRDPDSKKSDPGYTSRIRNTGPKEQAIANTKQMWPDQTESAKYLQ